MSKEISLLMELIQNQLWDPEVMEYVLTENLKLSTNRYNHAPESIQSLSKEYFNKIFYNTNGLLTEEPQIKKVIEVVSPVIDQLIPSKRQLEPIFTEDWFVSGWGATDRVLSFVKNSTGAETFSVGTHECLERRLLDYSDEQKLSPRSTHKMASVYTPIVCSILNQKHPNQGFDVSKALWRYENGGTCFRYKKVDITSENEDDFLAQNYLEACYYAFGNDFILNLFKEGENKWIFPQIDIEETVKYAKRHAAGKELNNDQQEVLIEGFNLKRIIDELREKE